MATATIEEHSCVTPNCGEKAKLRCPNCVKLGRTFHWMFDDLFHWGILGVLDGSYFCSQDCFKSYWQEHKKLHAPTSKEQWFLARSHRNDARPSRTGVYEQWIAGKLQPLARISLHGEAQALSHRQWRSLEWQKEETISLLDCSSTGSSEYRSTWLCRWSQRKIEIRRRRKIKQ